MKCRRNSIHHDCAISLHLSDLGRNYGVESRQAMHRYTSCGREESSIHQSAVRLWRGKYFNLRSRYPDTAATSFAIRNTSRNDPRLLRRSPELFAISNCLESPLGHAVACCVASVVPLVATVLALVNMAQPAFRLMIFGGTSATCSAGKATEKCLVDNCIVPGVWFHSAE